MKKEVTRRLYGNCWTVGVWLWLIGRVDSLAIVRTPGGESWPHLVGITKRGHLLAFGTGRDPQIATSCTLYPIWFLGQIRGCRKRYVRRVFGVRRIMVGSVFHD